MTEIFLLTHCSRCKHVNKYRLVDRHITRGLDLGKIKNLKIMSKSSGLGGTRKGSIRSWTDMAYSVAIF